jgi:hypothetical protein
MSKADLLDGNQLKRAGNSHARPRGAPSLHDDEMSKMSATDPREMSTYF